MKTEKFIECERNKFQKLINIRLPHRFMLVGITIALLSIVMMFVRAFAMVGDTLWLKLLLQKTVLIGMLILSLSKDKIEDEMTISLRILCHSICYRSFICINNALCRVWCF